MDFGLLFEMQVPKPWGPATEADAYRNGVAQAIAAEQAGFTHVWAVEHHFREEFSHMGAPEIWLTAVAQQTSRIRIGHGVVLLPMPFNHPVRVAERIGALDILSGGRVDFGTGRSIAELEIGGFGIDPGDTRDMWSESVEFLQRLWTSGEQEVEYHGKYLELPPRKVFPRPVQKPHPPMWMAATSPMSYALAGDYGLGVLAFGMAVDKDAMGRRLAEWRAAMAASTRQISVRNEQAAVFMMCFCAETEAAARAICQDSFVRYLDVTVEHFLRWGAKRELPPGYEWYATALKRGPARSGPAKFEYLQENGMILVGSPDMIAERIRGFKDAGATQMLVAMQLGDIPHDQVMKSIRLFGEEVIPAIG
ncbi:MAG TPA: LLM class flavin-dependent oxidoreductase [Streptosporangiaceae bacterium]|nr:LLM class flavin-dependent oxidoreductase [Streptosporangiaceae bacterium]